MNTPPLKELNQYFNASNELIIYNNGVEHNCTKPEISALLQSLQQMLTNSHEMPALGVSLDSETRNELKSGLWLEFNYKTTQTYNDMPFDSLLIKVEPENCGFNIIRKYNNLYEGRCYYINLDCNMSDLYNKILEI